MFHTFYATTKDKKGHEHNYKLSPEERAPYNEEIVSLSVAGRYKFSEIIGDKMAKDLKELFPIRKADRAKAE